MRAHRLMVSFVALVMGAWTALAQAPDTTALVRLSYVQGQVKILRGETTQFDQAQANMPLLAGYTLSTGEDGQAEVEFTDGSVARLTPNSQLRLDALPNANERNEPTKLTMVSGLGYFELNTANGQRFDVRFNAAVAQPVSNSIFRINLDSAPDLSVLVGTVRASVNGGFDQTVEEGRSLHFDADDASNVETASIQGDTWDQWNQDRDDQIAQQAQQQTSARETSGASNEPGWDDLDANGDWYPAEGYGNVWVPSNQPTGWDPYGNGYWADYPGWGYTWISGYPWGWLPYHCGAWNYWDSMGWGWIPGQCGLGWQPMVTVWNAPRGWRQPPRPIPGGHAGPPSTGNKLVPIMRGPLLPTRGITNHHTQPVRIDGHRVDPLPVLEAPALGTRPPYRGTGGVVKAAPVGRGYGPVGDGGNGVRVQPPIQGMRGDAPSGSKPPTVVPTRPVFRPAPPQGSPRPVMPAPQRITPPAPRPMPPASRPMPPAPRMSPPPAPRMAPQPRVYSPPPAPHVSAPPMSAPHPSGGPTGHR
jgi:uncharacterized protein DUF6600/FecR-like protein